MMAMPTTRYLSVLFLLPRPLHSPKRIDKVSIPTCTKTEGKTHHIASGRMYALAREGQNFSWLERGKKGTDGTKVSLGIPCLGSLIPISPIVSRIVYTLCRSKAFLYQPLS